MNILVRKENGLAVADDVYRFHADDYRLRTDNKYFPNTEEGWKEFLWKVHFLGGKSMILLWHFDQLEKKARRDAEQSNSSNQDDVSQGVLD
jgi:hypothetical protein